MHEVLYVHECPVNGGKRARIIQYDDPDHELKNLKRLKAPPLRHHGGPGYHEHYCADCGQPMTRLGTVREVRDAGPDGPGAGWERFDEPRQQKPA